MKSIEVVAAIIQKDCMYLATQRGYGDFKGMWEFPGGKVEPSENLEEALIREIKEELEVEIHIKKFLCTVEHTYPTFHITMHCFICQIHSGQLNLTEHISAKWLVMSDLKEMDWLPADIEVVKEIIKTKNNQKESNTL